MNPAYPRVAERANHRCEYCRAPEAMFNVEFEVEHVVPVSKSGTNDETNFALACRACNLKKSDCVDVFDEVSGTQVPLFHPRSDAWELHFQVDDKGTIVGRSPTGRVTVIRLALNSALQLSARQQWTKLGLFP